jgi:hypothetical protein
MITSRRDVYVGGVFAIVAAIIGAIVTGLLTSGEAGTLQVASPSPSTVMPGAPSTAQERTSPKATPRTPDPTPSVPPGLGEVRVYLSRDSGPSGTVVRASGEGYPPAASLVIMFHTTEIGSTRASPNGTFSNVALTIPSDYDVFAPHRFAVSVKNRSGPGYAEAPFMLT